MVAHKFWHLSYFSTYLLLLLMISVGSSFAQTSDNLSANSISANELIRQALANNTELAATRLEIERARARLKQAGLRPNPSIDFEHTTGGLTNSPNENKTSVGFSLPLELGGKRQRRIDLAQLEIAIAEATVADRERRAANEIRSLYAEALSAQRELEIMQRLNNLDVQTAQVIEVKIKEGESAPLELNLLKVEVERLKSRRSLAEGKYQAAILRLKNVAGIPLEQPLQLQEDLLAPVMAQSNYSLNEAVALALQTRPDLKAAQLFEQAAQAGLQLAKAQVVPDLVLSTKYSRENSAFDNTPVGLIKDKDNLLTFGVSVNLPLFNRNQGSQADASISITQAQKRREFLEQLIKAEVSAAYARYQSTQLAVSNFEQGVIAQSTNNLRIFREVYNLGELRITELITEQRRLVDSQHEYTDLLAERYRVLSDLNTAIGITSLGGTTK